MIYVEKLIMATCVHNFVKTDPFLQNYSKNTKNTNGPKFVDPRLAAVSPYF